MNVGPEWDIVGLWRKAARKAGLKFGVTEQLERSYSWFTTNEGAGVSTRAVGIGPFSYDPVIFLTTGLRATISQSPTGPHARSDSR